MAMGIYKRHRFPPEIISYAVWLYQRFNLSHRDIEDLLAERGIFVSRESIRLWCIKFGPKYARRLKRRNGGVGDTLFVDEVFVKIRGKQRYLWRAVDQDGDVVDVFLQRKRNGAAARRFFRRLLRSGEPRKIVTDKSGSYRVAHRELLPDAVHDTSQYANNRAELSHQSTRFRERGMKIQIASAGPTIPWRSLGGAESVQPGSPPSESGALPGPEGSCVLRMENGGGVKGLWLISLARLS